MTNGNTTTVNILLVDDRSDGLLTLEAVLTSPEYHLVKAGSGQEALKCLLDDEFALILMDVQMPGMSGFEVAEIIKTNQKLKDIPIIFITGINKENPHIHRGYEAGAIDYLFKPFDPQILKSKVALFIELFKKNKTIKQQAELLKIEHQQRYHNLADAIPHLVWHAQPDGTMDYLNKVWCDYTGLTLEQSRGKGWQEKLHPEDLQKLLAIWQSARQLGSSFEAECRVRNGASGDYHWYLVQMLPERDSFGQVIAWTGTGTDIHTRKQAADEMCKAREAALEADRAKTDFLANMSHEIRTPMNSVIGMTGLLLDTEGLTEEQKDYAETIRRSGQSLLTLINDILDFSKVESGKLELEILDFDLGELIGDCEKSFVSAAKTKGIDFTIEIAQGLPLNLKGDSGRIRQVLMNLINNAIKFTDKGGVFAKVLLQKNPTAKSSKVSLRFEIQDTGIGIPKTTQARMFQSFSQADSSTTRRFGGTGLGLSISKHLVELMGGQIGFASEGDGRGSLFWFTLALERGAGAQTKPEAKQMMKARSKEKGGRVLVAEDNPINQRVALKALEKLGYRAEAVGNGNEVLDALREIPYDLILMDCHMPDMDGYEATKIIRTSKTLERSEIPIIAMTANALKGDRERCMAVGMNDYISKPIDFEILADKLEKWTPGKILDQTALNKLSELQVEGQADAIEEFVGIFFKTAPQRLRKLKAALKGSDRKALFHEAHNLKSSCGYVGAVAMQRLCAQLEKMSEAESFTKLEKMQEQLGKEYEKVAHELRKVQEQRKYA